MKKLVFISSLFISGLLSAQTYPLSQNFDAVTTSGSPATGALPTGWTTTSGFKVYGAENLHPHGASPSNACTTEMSATHTKDTLYTPPIGPITASTKVSIAYRFVNKANYPATGYQLTASDKVVIDAKIAGTWQNNIATIDISTNPTPLTSYSTFTYNCTSCSSLVGIGQTTIQLRIDVARSAGDWYLDIDDFQAADVLTGITANAANAPALSVFPNPNNGNFTVLLKNYQANKMVEVSIYNYLGQKVKTVTAEGNVNNQISVNTLGLEKGMYMVEVKSGSEVAKTKIQID